MDAGSRLARGAAQVAFHAGELRKVAGAEGLEPPAYGFGDRRSTN